MRPVIHGKPKQSLKILGRPQTKQTTEEGKKSEGGRMGVGGKD